MIGSTTSMLVGGRGPIPAAEAGDVRDDAFLPYLPRLIREWAADPSLRHRQVDGSMLFVDLTGFTAMSERLARAGNVGAEEVTGIISETFAELLRHAYSHGGSLLKFGGDALLILFTDPDHALRAAAAGHNMKRALYDIGAITTSVGSIRLSMTGGIHSGTFDLFLAGDDPHELLITGPAASTVVATEGTARSGEIIVSEATASLLPPQDLSTRDDGTARLRRAPAIAGRPDVSEYAASASLADFVPAAVRRRVDAGESDPEHRRATIGFLKFQGVDALAIADPEDAAKELNRLVTDAQRAAGKHGATFLASDIDTDGGKLILVAGAPSATGHDEESMLLILRDVVSVDRGINVRAGAAAGTVFFGDVGPSFRRTLTVMGDTVNLSARLMAAADTGSVVTTRETLNESSVCFNVNRLDPLHLKGKKQAVEAVEVGTPSGKADHVDRSVPLIGRDTEMAVIRDALNGLPDGSGGAIEVRADPGMGKSMLLSTMLDSVPGARVLRVGCDLYDASTPYRAAQQLLSAFTGIDPAEPNATRDLHELVTAAAPELGPMLPLIATAFRMDMDDSPEVAALQPEFRNEVLYRTVGELISAMATDSAVAVIDDSHWADAASRDLLGSLAALAADRPWLLVFAGNTWTFHDDTVANHRIELGPLDHADAVDLANALTADRPIAPHEVEAIATRSGGVPTFLHGLIDAVLDGGDIDALPVGVEGMIAARLDELPAGARRVLRAAAVLGPSFDAPLLGSVSGASDDIERTLSALPRFVEAVGSDRYRFVDAMVQEVAYDRIPFKTRRSLHDGITDVLLAMPPDDGLVDQLAFHSYRAQRWSEAYEYATGAAERAETAYANVDAINLYEQALDAARHLTDPSDQTAEMWETVGDLHKRIGRSDRADVAYRKARRSRDDPLGLARLMHKHADLRRILGRYPEALRWLTRGLKEMEGLRDVGACAVRSELEAKYGAIRQTQGRPRDAIRWCERALESACPSGAVAAEALATKILDAALTTLGEGSEHALAYRALDLYEQANDLDGQARMMNNLGSYAFWRGDWPEAVRLWDQSSEILNRIGNAAMASLGSGNVAEVLADQGHLEEAEARFRDVRRIWNAAGVRRGEAFADLHLARIAARSGRLDEAADLFDAARDEFADIGASVEAAETDLRRAEGLLFAGKAHEAHGVLAESGLLPVPDDLPPPLIPVAHRVIGFGYLQNGDLGRARTSFHTAMEAARGQGARYEEALILAGQMRLALIAGDEFEALAEEHQRLVTELEVIALPAIPGPTG